MTKVKAQSVDILSVEFIVEVSLDESCFAGAAVAEHDELAFWFGNWFLSLMVHYFFIYVFVKLDYYF